MRAPILLLRTLILGVPAGASNPMLTTKFEVKAPIGAVFVTDGRSMVAPWYNRGYTVHHEDGDIDSR